MCAKVIKHSLFLNMLENLQQGDLKELEFIGTKRKYCHENKFSIKKWFEEAWIHAKGREVFKVKIDHLIYIIYKRLPKLQIFMPKPNKVITLSLEVQCKTKIYDNLSWFKSF